MMSLNRRLKSAALALTMVVSSASVCSDVVVNCAANDVMGRVLCSMSQNKLFSAIILAMVIGEIRIMTRSRVEYDYSDWRQDGINLLNSYNIFDAKSRATIMDFLDKYWAGAIVKLDDTKTKTKLDDGSVFTIERKKLTQKPSGVMGLIDAYILQQAKKVTENIPAIAVLSVLIYDPKKHFGWY